MKLKNKTVLIIMLSILMFSGVQLAALPLSFWFDVESGGAITSYNDVQIPADTGTRISLADDLSPEIKFYYRLQTGIDLNKHSLFLLYAPLLVNSTGPLDTDVDFYGETFAAGSPLTASYKFNSYRITYAYTFYKSPALRIAAGLTGKIRDAYISLENGTTKATRSNLGFVPLIHLSAEWFMTPEISILLKGDGLAVPQGRAEDFQLAIAYAPTQNMKLRVGYRLLEGGSDGGGSVYSFSMFHYISAGLQVKI
ncbi:MAG: hypothetical protein JEY99_00805 [Spirochaetales bacterium]|nr:hypothetical protein [Spirochaetales bacterium]